MNSRWQTSLFSEARPLKDSHLKLDALGIVAQDQPRVFHERRERDSARNRWLVACIVDQEDGTRLRHEVDGGDGDDEK